jgi:tol-pal system protein YbgF
VLQQQVRELSGLVEEQAYLIKKLQQDQRQQYVDLDRRLMALNRNRPTPGPAPIPEPGTTTVPGFITVPRHASTQVPIRGAGEVPNQTASSEPLAQGASGSSDSSPGPTEPAVALASQPPIAAVAPKPANEREAYAQAIEWMRGKRFAESTQALESLIVDYPNGQFTPNAFYWLGELKLATGETEAARQNFVQVVRLYPDHQKVPDALYKLGVLYFQLGDASEARRYLQRVRSEFPQSTAGTLATRYLAEME